MMSISRILPQVIVPFIPIGTHAEGKLSADDAFVLIIARYLSHLHRAVMQSWQKFSESTQAHAEQNNEKHRLHTAYSSQETASRLEGEKRRGDLMQASGEEVAFLSGVHRQAGKLRYHQGTYTSDIDRHLNLPI